MTERASYRTVVKNTSVVGGARVVQMLIAILRSKIVAVLIGTTGMGINNLISQGIMVVSQFSSMGIFESGTRELAALQGDPGLLAERRRTFKKLALLCGLAGLVVCLCASPLLSAISFGGGGYTLHFAAVAIAVLFMALQNSSATVMQATGRLKLLAKGSIASAAGNLVIAAACYWFWGTSGIVPAIVAGSAFSFAVFALYERRIPFAVARRLSAREALCKGKPMLRQGSAIMTGQLLMIVFTFLLNGFISNFGSISQAGLYSSAMAICMNGLVVINSTLSADYFPRLSALGGDREAQNGTMNTQTEIMTLIVVPVSIVMIAGAPLVVRILLNESFMPIVPLLRLMGLSLLFRMQWNIFGFIALARGDNKTYLMYDAILGHGSVFTLNVAAYYLWGLHGLGVSFLVGSVFMALVLGVIVRLKYGMSLRRKTLFQLAALVVVTVAMFWVSEFMEGVASWLISGAIATAVFVWCYVLLDRRIGIKDLWKTITKR